MVKKFKQIKKKGGKEAGRRKNTCLPTIGEKTSRAGDRITPNPKKKEGKKKDDVWRGKALRLRGSKS